MKQRALAIARKTSGDRSVAALKAANDLEIVRVEKLVIPEFERRLNTALPMALAQIRQAEATLGPDDANVARGLSNLAAIYGSSKVGLRSAAIAMSTFSGRAYRLLNGGVSEVTTIDLDPQCNIVSVGSPCVSFSGSATPFAIASSDGRF